MIEKEIAGKSTMNESLPTPLILHSSLQRSSFTDYLGSAFKIRVSNKTPTDSVILPRCGVAILIVQMHRISYINPNTNNDCRQPSCSGESCDRHSEDTDVDQETLDHLTIRVSSFLRGHRVGVVVLVGAVFGEVEVGGVISRLQMTLLPRPPLILPAHGDAQAAAHVQVLAKATLPERRQVVDARMGRMVKEALGRDHTHTLARAMGLNYHQVSVLVDSLGSLGSIAQTSAEEIHRRTPLSASTAEAIVAFFTRDTVTV